LNPVRRSAQSLRAFARSLRVGHAISFERLVRLFPDLLEVEAAGNRGFPGIRLTLDGKPLLNAG
jgi:hypothetical protein